MSETRPSPAQGTLELEDLDGRRPAGRVEAAVRRSALAAGLTTADEGAAEAAAAIGRGLDLAVGRGDPYAVAAVGKPLMEQLARLGLDPQARGDGSGSSGSEDPWDTALREAAEAIAREKMGAPDASRPG